MKTLLKEFKEFAVKGNVVDMAVGVIVGGAIDFSNLFLPLDGNTYATLAEAEAAGAAVLKYGSFLSQVLDFLIVSFVIFIFVKKIMALGRKKEAPVEEAPKTKVCPYCKSEIAIDATRCPHCTSELP